jgi:hypothetical protein
MRARTALGFALVLLCASASAQPEARWTFYRDFWFNEDSAALEASDRDSIRDVARYVHQNNDRYLAIDAGASEGALRNQRIAVIRDALVAAGVPKSRIQEGRFGDERLRRERRVEILINARD